jgi:SAM-dependent methyltransferase
MNHDEIVQLYERHAHDFDRDRGRSLQEQGWLDAFLRLVAPGGVVLDLGCGMGEPVARYLSERGFNVFGVDSSPSVPTAASRCITRAWIRPSTSNCWPPMAFRCGLT